MESRPEQTPTFDPTDAVAITPGGGRLGSLLGGALDSRLVELSLAEANEGRVVPASSTSIEASALGVQPGTVVRIVFARPMSLPEAIWEPLLERQPVGIVAEPMTDSSHRAHDPRGFDRLRLEESRSVRLGPDALAGRCSGAGRWPMRSTARRVRRLERGTGGWRRARHRYRRHAVADRRARRDGPRHRSRRPRPASGTRLACRLHRVDRPDRVAAGSWRLARLPGRHRHESRPWARRLPIGARTPEEVAVSVVCEMLSVRNECGH